MHSEIARAGSARPKQAERRFQFSLKSLVFATLICGVLMGAGFVAWSVWKDRTEIVESLSDPQEVNGWTANGLQLSDGRTVALPGIDELPKESPTLNFAVSHGVELQDGRVFTLIEIYHWCGSDPVRKHWVRADLAHALRYTEEVLPVGDGDQVQWLPNPLGGQIIQNRMLWDASAYYDFMGQEALANQRAQEGR